jgi:hypothetical protein
MSNMVALRVNLGAKGRFGAFSSPNCGFDSAQSNVHSAHMCTLHENPQRIFLSFLYNRRDGQIGDGYHSPCAAVNALASYKRHEIVVVAGVASWIECNGAERL